MKIKILTFHFTRNYGATLQVFALCTYLRSIGHNVEVINYLPPSIANEYSLFSFKKRNLIKALLTVPFLIARNARFRSFLRGTVALTKKYYSFMDLCDARVKADAFIVGSDQVWNSDITQGIDPVYFLDFVDSGLKISYAASFGKNSVPLESRDQINKYLKKFTAISVREESSITMLRQINSNLTLKCVLDPVFLLNRDIYLSIAGKDTAKKDYLFIYDVHPNPLLFQVAQNIADMKNMPIVAIARAHTSKRNADKLIYFCGPKEFLRLLVKAKYVVTNSYHATCMSILMNKDFNVVANPTLNDRITDILHKFVLVSRFVSSDTSVVTDPIDYTHINNLLNEARMQSFDFLINAINQNTPQKI